MTAPTMFHRLAAEFIGTFWLVLGGCGSAVFAAKFTSDGVSFGIGFLGVALAFGLTVLTGVYAFGTISGGHFNPAVTLGAALARRVEWKALPVYWAAQVVGWRGRRAGDLRDRQGQGRLDRHRQHGGQRLR
jgi:aquaporin Z